MIPTLARWVAVLASMFSLWFITAGLVIHAVVVGLHGLELAWAWFYPDLERGLTDLGVSTSWLRGGGLILEPDWGTTLKWTAMIALTLTALPAASYCVTPLRHHVARSLGRAAWKRTKKIKSGDELGRLFAGVLEHLGEGRSVKLYLVAGSSPLAFAMAAPFRGAVVISQGLVSALTREELEWVLAHEVAHIRHRDMAPSVVWLASMRAVGQFEAIQIAIVNAVLRILGLLRVPGFLLRVLVWVIQAVIWTLHIGRRVAIRLFLVADRWVSRAMEYRADAVAAEAYGPGPGTGALSRLGGDAEPLFNGLFATHPRISDRIRRLHERF